MEQPIERYRKQIRKEISDVMDSFKFEVNSKENRELLARKVDDILEKYLSQIMVDNEITYVANVAVVSTSPTDVELIACDAFTANLFREIFK